MLRSINISNFVLISRLEMDFHTGLTVLTGETGSGKSIIVDALGLLLGSRSFTESIREGESVALIEGVFSLEDKSGDAAWALLEDLGIERQDKDELIIRRELNTSGRNRIYLNDRSITSGALKALRTYLVDIHGQGEHQDLLSKQTQMDLLDSFAGTWSLRDRVAEAYTRYKTDQDAILKLKQDVAQKEQLEDILRYQLSEIKRVSPQPLEDEDLSLERSLLSQAEKVSDLVSKAYEELYEYDDSVLSKLATIKRWIQNLSDIDGRMAASLTSIEAAELSLSDTAETLRSYKDRVDFSPERLNAIEERLAQLERLKRKYNVELSTFPKMVEDLEWRLKSLEETSVREKELNARLEQSRREYITAAGELTVSRKSAALEFEKRVTSELRHVAMEHTVFCVNIDTFKEEEAESFYTPRGSDQLEFLVSTNTGESPKPLSRVASGGELSRLMLTLRLVSSMNTHKGGRGETLVFDEVDAGIGGKAADAVGRRLKALSQRQQVLCVTHQAQIAKYADYHYVVSKDLKKGRTLTSVHELSYDDRVQELARMIGGSEEQAPRDAARWLLEKAYDLPSSVGKRAKRRV